MNAYAVTDTAGSEFLVMARDAIDAIGTAASILADMANDDPQGFSGRKVDRVVIR